MSVDKRSVATDALATLGTVIDETAERDAIHVAVEPVEAGAKLFPGQHVSVVNGVAVPISGDTAVGIVDPFVERPLMPGERFWLFVYPRTITSLRHVWDHPAFESKVVPEPAAQSDPAEESHQWITDFAQSVGLGYDTVMNGAEEMVESLRSDGYGEYLVFGGLLEGKAVPDEFWNHYETVTGERVAEDHRQSFFSCSC